MIQIIKGTFGYYNGRKVVPVTNADGPQTFDPELEANLVKQGVAEYVQQEPTTEPETDKTLPEYSEDMKLDELKEIAAAYGVDASAMRKKSDVIKAIEATKETADEQTGGDDEEPPRVDAADPV